jgi:uncharacterized membrane protein YebE (DUF533 family)
MSLKRTAMKMAIAFAAAKGYKAFRDRGGMEGVKRMLSQGGSDAPAGGRVAPPNGAGASLGGASGTGGGLGALLGGGGAGGGLGAMLGQLAGGTGTGSTGGASGGVGGLLGGLAAMAGGSAALGGSHDETTLGEMAEKGPQDEATAAVMVRAIGQAVRADGEIDARERALLNDILAETETAEDRAALEAALAEPVHPEALARDVPRGHEAEVYAAALTAIDPDREPEREFLKRFSTALALAPSEITHLHATAGKLG